MKKICLSILFVMLTVAAFAAKKNFDIKIKDTNGKVHHIHGWIEYSLFPPSIDHGDFWYDDTHFIFSAPINENPEGFEDYSNLDIEGSGFSPDLPLNQIYSELQNQIPSK